MCLYISDKLLYLNTTSPNKNSKHDAIKSLFLKNIFSLFIEKYVCEEEKDKRKWG